MSENREAEGTWKMEEEVGGQGRRRRKVWERDGLASG